MHNSYATFLLGLYSCCFKDIKNMLPVDLTFDMDIARIERLVKSRGISFAMIDMPQAAKHFERCLADGELTPFNLPGFRKKNGSTVIPHFLEGILSLIFTKNGVLKEDVDSTLILAVRQILLLSKKFKIDCTNERINDAVVEFIETEREVRHPSLDWAGVDPFCSNTRDFHIRDVFDESESSDPVGRTVADYIQRTADCIATEFGWFDPSEWSFKHGPGAVSDRRGKSYKYDFSSWPRELEHVFPSSEYAYSNHGQWAESLSSPLLEDSPVSKLIAVPKTLKGPRLIASEPLAMQWCQQSIKDFLYKQISRTSLRHSINFFDQSKNQRLALKSSFTNSHWTIDLSSASDRVSCFLVERIFRCNRPLLEALHASRSRFVTNGVKGTPSFNIKLNKFTTQGAAVTFPIQSIVFACIAIGCILYQEETPVTSNNIRRVGKDLSIFGDDIIVPKKSGRLVTEWLSILGLKVNTSKTFGTGKFRESCGMDAYNGEDVTPTYCTNSFTRSDPTSLKSIVDQSNNFHRKGFFESAEWLRKTIPSWILNKIPVVDKESGSFGFISFCGSSIDHLQKRFNKDLQRDEILVLDVKNSTKLQAASGYGPLLQYFTEAPPQDLMWSSGWRGTPRHVFVKRWDALYGVLRTSKEGCF